MSNSQEFDYNSSPKASYHVAIATIIFALANLNYNSLRSNDSDKSHDSSLCSHYSNYVAFKFFVL